MNDGRGQQVVVIGGGTGAPNLARALRRLGPTITVSVVLPVTDSGRSSGVIRRLLNIPAPGDLRQSLTTLAVNESDLATGLEFRLDVPHNPDLHGMAIGNLVLGALTQKYGDIGRATAALRTMLSVPEAVLPASVHNLQLRATLADGSSVLEELAIREPGKARITDIEAISSAAPPSSVRDAVWPVTRSALSSASWVVLGPGSLWTSVGAVLAIQGVVDSIRESQARTIFVCNTTTQPGQTDGMSVTDHVNVIAKLLANAPDIVIVNSERPDNQANKPGTSGLDPIYIEDQELTTLRSRRINVITADLIGRNTLSSSLWQKMPTAYHDMERVAGIIGELIAVQG